MINNHKKTCQRCDATFYYFQDWKSHQGQCGPNVRKNCLLSGYSFIFGENDRSMQDANSSFYFSGNLGKDKSPVVKTEKIATSSAKKDVLLSNDNFIQVSMISGNENETSDMSTSQLEPFLSEIKSKENTKAKSSKSSPKNHQPELKENLPNKRNNFINYNQSLEEEESMSDLDSSYFNSDFCKKNLSKNKQVSTKTHSTPYETSKIPVEEEFPDYFVK